MATHSVNVLVKARDEASKKFGVIGKSAGSMSSMLKKAAVAAAAYFSARAIKGFLTESLELYGRQDRAVRGLSDALNLLGKGGADAMRDMQQFASSIQKVTIYGDEAVLELMKMGASMGKLSGKELQDATKAAIGLAAAYKIDVTAAMRLVARARVGDTASLKRYGIVLGEGLTAQEKFNRILQIGARNFKLAEGETRTYSGAILQAKNAVGDLKEIIGKALAPVIKDFAGWVKTVNLDTLKSALNTAKWIVSISAAIIITPKIIAAITGIVKAFKALAAGQAIVQGLAGPVGWATLAAGAAFAAAAVVEINHQFDKFIDKLDDDFSTAEEEVGGVNKVLGQMKSNLGGLNTAGAKVANTIKSITSPEPWKKIHDEIGLLKQSIVDFGRTEEELFLRRMKEVGYQSPSLEMVKSYYRQTKALEKQKSMTEAVTDTVKELQREIKTFGKDEFAVKLFDLKALGAGEAQLKTIKNLMNDIRGLREKEREKEREKPKRFMDDFKRSFPATEARFLTFAPGTRFKWGDELNRSAKEQAKNAAQQVALSGKGINKQEELIGLQGDQINRQNVLIHLTEAIMKLVRTLAAAKVVNAQITLPLISGKPSDTTRELAKSLGPSRPETTSGITTSPVPAVPGKASYAALELAKTAKDQLNLQSSLLEVGRGIREVIKISGPQRPETTPSVTISYPEKRFDFAPLVRDRHPNNSVAERQDDYIKHFREAEKYASKTLNNMGKMVEILKKIDQGIKKTNAGLGNNDKTVTLIESKYS